MQLRQPDFRELVRNHYIRYTESCHYSLWKMVKSLFITCFLNTSYEKLCVLMPGVAPKQLICSQLITMSNVNWVLFLCTRCFRTWPRFSPTSKYTDLNGIHFGHYISNFTDYHLHLAYLFYQFPHLLSNSTMLIFVCQTLLRIRLGTN